MTYDFDKMPQRRGTSSQKWDKLEELFGGGDLLSLWVADMDFNAPDFITDAIKRRADHPVYGYTFPPDSLREAIADKSARDFGWRQSSDWLCFTNGVVDGLSTALQAVLPDGGDVVIQPPVYHQFATVVQHNRCRLLENPLTLSGGRYSIDYDGLESLLAGGAKALILCSPHNPVGRVWSFDELYRLGELCLKYNTIVLSDEIHCDLVFAPHRHIPFACVDKRFESISITFTAATKTFNIPGLSTAVATIPDEELRSRFQAAQFAGPGGNLFGYAATEAAYRHGDRYRTELTAYIKANAGFFKRYIDEHLPMLKVIEAEGTYLLWLDMRALNLSDSELDKLIREKCHLALNNGVVFGSQGSGFQRFNLGCPRAYLAEALDRLRKGVQKVL